MNEEDLDDELSTRRNLHPRQPIYFYRVEENKYAFNEKREIVDKYKHVEDFNNPDLTEARSAAVKYLTERYLQLYEDDKFIYPYATPGEKLKKGQPLRRIATISLLCSGTMTKNLKKSLSLVRMKNQTKTVCKMKLTSGNC